MKLLKCIVCNGEVDIVGNEYAINKLIQCRQCGFSNQNVAKKEPEVVIIKKRINQ